MLWNLIDGEYHYFIKSKNHGLLELTNTKNALDVYQEQYKTTLEDVTESLSDVSQVLMTLPSLARFIDDYNSKISSKYVPASAKLNADFLMGVFGGITNSPFVGNPKNVHSPVFGAEIEMLVGTHKKHSGYFQIRHVMETDAFKYQTSELSLGYRYRFVQTSRLSLYADVKFATLNFSKATIHTDDKEWIPSASLNNTAFDLPLLIGLGADVRLTQSLYANLSYSQIFAVFFKNQGNFPSDITFGLKFKVN